MIMVVSDMASPCRFRDRSSSKPVSAAKPLRSACEDAVSAARGLSRCGRIRFIGSRESQLECGRRAPAGRYARPEYSLTVNRPQEVDTGAADERDSGAASELGDIGDADRCVRNQLVDRVGDDHCGTDVARHIRSSMFVDHTQPVRRAVVAD